MENSSKNTKTIKKMSKKSSLTKKKFRRGGDLNRRPLACDAALSVA